MGGDGITAMGNMMNVTSDATILITGISHAEVRETDLMEHFLFMAYPRGWRY